MSERSDPLSGKTLLAEVRRLARQPGLMQYTGHALNQMADRKITRLAVEHVLCSGHHVPDRDRYNSLLNEWTYAIEGVALEGSALRIAVAFVTFEPIPDRVVLVVTALRV